MDAPIVFTARGLDIDTRFYVFGTEFHVHSVILKQKSHFFFRFLDPLNKEPKVKDPKSGFKYKWASRMDDDYDDSYDQSGELDDNPKNMDMPGWFLVAGDPEEVSIC
jgi:hypothetical protein